MAFISSASGILESQVELYAENSCGSRLCAGRVPNVLEVRNDREVALRHPLIVHFEQLCRCGARNILAGFAISPANAHDVLFARLDQAFVTKSGAAENRHGADQRFRAVGPCAPDRKTLRRAWAVRPV